MSNLFEQAQSLNNSKKSLFEFKAGKMTKEGTLVSPDERKGKVVLTKVTPTKTKKKKIKFLKG